MERKIQTACKRLDKKDQKQTPRDPKPNMWKPTSRRHTSPSPPYLPHLSPLIYQSESSSS